MDFDAFQTALQVGAALEKLGVPFHLGGSLASSIHGLPRATLDADLVADLRPGQGRTLVRLLGSEFYADAQAIEEAIERRASFNVIHLKTMFKVDVFVLEDEAFHRESFRRSRPEKLLPFGAAVRVATPEDTVLHKLLWFQKGGGVSDRQWGDLLGILKVQGGRIDEAYLQNWAGKLGIGELLERALRQASGRSGSHQPPP
ncbi:MAG: hypothetical protein HY717_13540 [Planctomycetes bacterium]|nr:hypothetical protein [Planctomycetota bacterium]